MEIFFSFYILRWHIIVQINQSNMLFLKTGIFTNKASLMLIFFWGLHVTSEIYYNLSIKGENYQLD